MDMSTLLVLVAESLQMLRHSAAGLSPLPELFGGRPDPRKTHHRSRREGPLPLAKAANAHNLDRDAVWL